ncbi:hypothetical protein H8L32_18660 [Undibacterium sp. CY18W]|uniref:Lipoprotein n=1 Tax=Undibacterium hunanense TaxID=2762292 RepID=A0ABR6ZVH7_9BURK|nr:hypothetical protein [Undibacterium hunanense]MBC3919515.1 hypothetical protein [Undibacterium hunanense]
MKLKTNFLKTKYMCQTLLKLKNTVLVFSLPLIFLGSCAVQTRNPEIEINWIDFNLDKNYPMHIHNESIDVVVKNPMLAVSAPAKNEILFTADLEIASKPKTKLWTSGIKMSGEFKILEQHDDQKSIDKQIEGKPHRFISFAQSDIRFVAQKIEIFPACDLNNICTDDFKHQLEDIGSERLKIMIVYLFNEHDLCHSGRVYSPATVIEKEGKLVIQLGLNPRFTNVKC